VNNWSQCTILWHIDHRKISHVDPNFVPKVVSQLEGIFGVEAPLTKNRGTRLDYLGMSLDFSHKDAVQVTMYDYIDTMLHDLPPAMDGEVPTPTASHLFDVNHCSSEMLLARADVFLCKHACPDLQTAVAFLCTQVKAPDSDVYKKLTQDMRYLCVIRLLPLTLAAHSANMLRWWVDPSFVVQEDIRSHTGGYLRHL
jgi:hypothetical protein